MLPSASILHVSGGSVAVVAAFAAFSAGYAFRESMVIHGGDRPMHLIMAGRGAIFGVLVGVLVIELAAVVIGLF